MIYSSLTCKYGDTVDTVFKPLSCNLEFFVGDEETLRALEKARKFVASSHDILTSVETNCTQSLIDRNEEMIEGLRSDFALLRKKNPILLLHQKAYQKAKTIRDQIDNLVAENGVLQYEMEEIEKKQSRIVEERIAKYRQMLKVLGFEDLGISSNLSGSTTETFATTLTEDQLKARALEYYDTMYSNFKKDVNSLREFYGMTQESDDKVQ